MMQHSIRAFVVAACLLMPQAVESKKMTAHRSLQMDSMESPQMGSMMSAFMDTDDDDDDDDDNILGFLEGLDIDPALETCILATEALYADIFADNLETVANTTENGITVENDIDLQNNTITVSITYSEEANQLLGTLCDAAGGRLEVIDQVSCSASDPTTGVEINTVMTGISECLADIPECGPNTLPSILSLAMSLVGTTCTIGDTPAVIPEPVEPDPLSEVEEDSQMAEDSGAGSGLQTTGLLALTGIAVAATNLM
jgi:hypothetical protein